MDAVLSSHYFRVGLGYAFGVNIAGLWLMYRALRSDLFFFRGSVQVPRWFLVACGLLFQGKRSANPVTRGRILA